MVATPVDDAQQDPVRADKATTLFSMGADEA